MNAPKVAANGVLPRTWRPTAAPTMHCSAMYISRNRSGATFWKSSVCVELPTSPSRTTRRGFAAIAARVSPNAFRVAMAPSYVGTWYVQGFGGCGIRSSGFGGVIVMFLGPPSSAMAFSASSLDRALPCQPSLLARKETPWPFSVLATTMTGLPASASSASR